MPTLIFVLNSHFRFIKKKKKKIKGDKYMKIIANNPNNPKLQHSLHITNN
jgi:hypothetical protein